VAVLALQSERTGVNGRLGMALDALAGRASENLIRVARAARCLGVHTLQREKSRMVKI
jgi:hypothetical protein